MPESDGVPTLTWQKKVQALAEHYYLSGHGKPWTPKASDYYTIRRADLELFWIAGLKDDGTALAVNMTHDPECANPMTFEDFVGMEFHAERIPVPEWILRGPENA